MFTVRIDEKFAILHFNRYSVSGKPQLFPTRKEAEDSMDKIVTLMRDSLAWHMKYRQEALNKEIKLMKEEGKLRLQIEANGQKPYCQVWPLMKKLESRLEKVGYDIRYNRRQTLADHNRTITKIERDSKLPMWIVEI